MKTLFAIFIALVFVSCADSENKKEIQPDYSTPEKALETFVQAVDAWDLEIMANSTTHPEMNIELLEMQKNDVIDLYSF